METNISTSHIKRRKNYPSFDSILYNSSDQFLSKLWSGKKRRKNKVTEQHGINYRVSPPTRQKPIRIRAKLDKPDGSSIANNSIHWTHRDYWRKCYFCTIPTEIQEFRLRNSGKYNLYDDVAKSPIWHVTTS